jgi:hypothetical protein
LGLFAIFGCDECTWRVERSSADPTRSNVTAVAINYGFWDLGRFSIEYRALFGESPRDALRRPPEHSFH